MTKVHKYTVSKKEFHPTCEVQNNMETGRHKMLHFEMSVFKTRITVASEQNSENIMLKN